MSSYFEKQQKGKTPEQSVGYSTAPAESAGGPSPMGGGSAGATSAPKAAQGGGTGFVSFGQYFGGNAPAVQAQAQKTVGTAAAPKMPTAPGGMGMARPERFGPAPTASTVVSRQKAGPSADPYAAQIAQTSAQFAALNPAAQSGDMGENVGAFDQLLGGGETQRAAKSEQQRLGTLRAALEGQQGQFQAQQAQSQQAKADADRRAKEEKAYYDMMDLERRKAEYAASQQSAEDNKSWWDSFMDNLSIGPVRD
jgi:hypothetical protein